MTEADCLECTDLEGMLRFVRDKVSDRKPRLLSCAFSRLAWHLLCDVGREAIRVAERYADGEVGEADAEAAQRAVQALLPDDGTASPYSPLAWALQWGTGNSSYPPWYAAWLAGLNIHQVVGVPYAYLAALLRDVIGNPFRPVSVDPAWQTLTVVRLAQAAYRERHLAAGALDPARLAVLADALEDAGCTDEAILSHLRGPGPHVCGCWVLDLLLGRE